MIMDKKFETIILFGMIAHNVYGVSAWHAWSALWEKDTF